MSTRSIRIGAAKAYFPLSTTSAVAGFSGASPTLTWTASSVLALDTLVNGENPVLDTTAQYYFIIAPLGEDKLNGGYTIGSGSPIVGPLTVDGSTTTGFCLQILAANFTTNLNKAGGVLIFMRKNSSDYIPHSIAVVDVNGNDFSTLIVNEPTPGAVGYTAAQLQTAVADTTMPFGSRAPYGYQWVLLSPSTGGIDVSFDVNQVPVSPDNSPDYTAVAGRGCSFSLKLLANAVKDIIRANAGNYAKFTLPGSTKIVEVATMANQTAISLISGNKPWKLLLPPDANRVSEVQVFYAATTQNQTGGNMLWSKSQTTPVDISVQNINVDTLLDDICAVSSYSIRTPAS